MANKKFSEFELKTTTSNVSHIVGYNGAENVRITPANFLDTTGGPYLPLAGGTMTGTNGVVFPDNFYLNLGTSSDFEIYHDGNNSYLKDQGTGELILASNGTGIKLEKTSGEKMIHALTDGAVELYYDSVKKFETTLLGATVTGDVTIENSLPKITLKSTDNTAISGDTVSSVEFYAGDSSSAGQAINAKILSYATDNFGRLGLKFLTGGNGTPEDRLTIDSVGNSTFAGNVDITTGIIQLAQNKIDGSSDNLKISADFGNVSGSSTIEFLVDGSEKMRLNSSGNLGIGTSTPDALLEVSKTIGASIRITSTATGNGANTILGSLEYYGNDISVPGAGVKSSIVAKTEASLGDDSNLIFSTSNGITNNVEKMRLDANGNLGIGTSNPEQLLTLNEATNNTSLGFYNDGTNAANRNWVIGTNDLAFGDFAIMTSTAIGGNPVSAGVKRLYISNTGNVGVGTATPTEKLEVSGGAAAILIDSTTNEASLKYDNSTTTSEIKLSNNDLKFVLGGTERMRLDSSGNLLVGRTSKTSTSTNGSAYILGDIASGGVNDYAQVFVEHSSVVNHGIIIKELASTGIAMGFLNSSGTTVGRITTTATDTAYNTTSDYRLKEDLQDFKGLDLVSKIPVYDYKWKAEDSRSYGVMAHELAEVLPDAVTGDKDAEEMQGVDYSKIVPLLVKSIQELKAEIELLKNK